MKIEFITDDPQVMKDFPPIPISQDLPKWMSKLSDTNEFNVSHCPPVMDWITSGYLIHNAWEYILEERILNFRKGIHLESQNLRLSDRKLAPNVLSGECLPVEGGPYSYFKLDTDYKVVTPPGYSCMVMQPYYDFNQRFSVLPGIIDTDKHDWTVSAFAYTKEKNLRIVPGEKILQIIPFKRDSWEMELTNEKIYSQVFHYIRKAYK
ncbi:MAG: hypothetical protein L7S72_01895, partial [Flavobacteriales bacterium]|nr:hypothetical protein [Flavobacteriales bacterium]